MSDGEGYDFSPDRVAYHRGLVLAAHRPVPFHEGVVSEHADGCDSVSGERYGRLDAWDPPLELPMASELAAAYGGPPCRPDPAFEHGICAGCSYLNSGMPLVHTEDAVPWPCSYVIALGGTS